jgi:hypothetical protein
VRAMSHAHRSFFFTGPGLLQASGVSGRASIF